MTAAFAATELPGKADTAALIKPGDLWRSPKPLVAKLVEFAGPVGGIALDPCGSSESRIPVNGKAGIIWAPGAENTVPAKRVICWPKEDGLVANWWSEVKRVGGGIAYVNSPYSAQLIGPWVRKTMQEAWRVEIVTLVQASIGVRWFNCLLDHASRGLEIGRVKFEGADQGARFVSALFYFGGRSGEFMRVFGDMGRRLT